MTDITNTQIREVLMELVLKVGKQVTDAYEMKHGIWEGISIENSKSITQSSLQLQDYMAEQRADARRIAKSENVRDFSAVVKAFNDALTAGFDAPSVRILRMVLNNADNRANYINLPEQLSTPNPIKSKETE